MWTFANTEVLSRNFCISHIGQISIFPSQIPSWGGLFLQRAWEIEVLKFYEALLKSFLRVFKGKWGFSIQCTEKDYCNYFILLTSYIPVVVSRRSSSLLVFCCAGSRKVTNQTTAALWKDVVGNFFSGVVFDGWKPKNGDVCVCARVWECTRSPPNRNT